MAIVRESLAFLVVGAVGFAIDAGILAVFFHVFDWGHYASRLVSFAAAVTVTWLLNRIWTFAHRATDRPLKEYVTYLLVQTLGSVLNLGIYAVCITSSEVMHRYPVLALACGAFVAMIFNFVFSRHFAFTGRDIVRRRRNVFQG